MMQKPVVTNFTAKQIGEWLTHAHSNGVSPCMAELLKYRYQPLRLPVPKASGSSAQAGQRLSKTRGRGMEFDEVRHYQAGDDVRAIDWRVTARTGQTHTKLFREEKERPVFLCIDFSSSMWFGSQLLLKSMQAAHVAAGIAWHTVQRGDRVGGLIFNRNQHVEIKPQARQHGALLLLKQLIALHPNDIPDTNRNTASTASTATKQNLEQQLLRLMKLCRPGADIVVVSDFSELDNATIKLLQSLRKHHTVTAIMITDPFEENLPSDFFRDIDVHDGKEQHTLFLSNPEYHKKWQQQAVSWQSERQQGLQRAGVRLTTISAALPANSQWFHRGKK